MNSSLYIVNQANLDTTRWNRLVDSSENGRIFHYSWYLETFTNFSILMYGDYKGGLILPHIKKQNWLKIYQPSFIQQCGWIGESPKSSNLKSVLLSHASFIHINTNLPIANSTKRINQYIQTETEQLYIKKYSKSTKKNLTKSKKLLTVIQTSDIKTTINLYRNAYGSINPQLKDEHYAKLESIVTSRPASFSQYSVYKEDRVVAAILLAHSKNRYHYILGAPTQEGRTLNALTVGIDFILNKLSTDSAVFDFEGSSIPSVYDYYRSFGAEEEYFYESKIYSRLISSLLPIYNKFFKS